MTLRRCVSCKYDDCDCVSVCVDFTQEPGCPTHFYTDLSGNQRAIPVQVFGPYVHDDQGPFNPLVDAGCWSRVGGLPDCKVCCGGAFDGKCATGSLCVDGGGTTRNFDGLRNANGHPTCRQCQSLSHGCNPEYDIYNPHNNACVPGACCHPHPDCGCTPDVQSIWYDCGLGNMGSGIVGGTCSDCTVGCCRATGGCTLATPANCIDGCETGGCTCNGVNCAATTACCGGVSGSTTLAPSVCRQMAPCACKAAGGTVPTGGPFPSCYDSSDYCNPCTISCCTPRGNCREHTEADCNAICELINGQMVCGTPLSNKCCESPICDDLTDCCICDPSNPQSLSVCVQGVTRQYCDQVRGRAIANCNLPGPNHTLGDQCLTTCCYPETLPGGIVTNKCIENITFEECHRVRNGASHNCNPCSRIESTGIGCGNACCNLDVNANRICTIKSTADCLASGGEPQPYSSCRLPGCTGSDSACQVCESACCCRNFITQQTRCIVTQPGKCQALTTSACQELGPGYLREGEVIRQRTCSENTCGTGCCMCGRCADFDSGICAEFGGVPIGETCKNSDCSTLDIKPPCSDALSEPMMRPDALAIPITRGLEKLNDVPLSELPCQQYGGDIRFSDDAFGHAYFCNRWDRLRPEGTKLSRCVVVIDQVSGLAFFKCPYRRECPDFN